MGTPSAKKRKKSESPEAQFQAKLNQVTKSNDLLGAVALFDSAAATKTPPRLALHHFNALLHICASSAANSDPNLRREALTHGLRIFSSMPSAGVVPNEASVLSAARLAAADSDPRRAFSLAKSLAAPRLRTFDPALFGFVGCCDADAAFEVERHMAAAGLEPEEPELSALLKVSSDCGRGEMVYEYLHKLRVTVGCVRESTAEVIESWFLKSGCGEVRDYWVVKRCRVDPITALCGGCGHELACVDIDEEDTERFARSLASLSTSRESKFCFAEFQEWVDQHADYEAIVDGANVGLYQQNFAGGGFSMTQLEAVVKELYERSGNKWPLVVLHNTRSRELLENPSTRKVVEEWLEKGILYTTPSGSNDDWYWLYATVKLKCLLVTNDEMRDHIFELLGSSFFLKWKERHHVKYTFVKGNLQLQMPPQYSSIIQESVNGSWHIPIASGNSIEESERTWLCVTKKYEASGAIDTYGNGDGLRCSGEQMESYDNTAYEISNNKTPGKRKERSPDASLPPN